MSLKNPIEPANYRCNYTTFKIDELLSVNNLIIAIWSHNFCYYDYVIMAKRDTTFFSTIDEVLELI